MNASQSNTPTLSGSNQRKGRSSSLSSVTTGKRTANGGGKTSCVTCSSNVTNRQKSMQCDLCSKWTHINCDNKIPEELYDCLTKNDCSSLIYLCVKCRPMILPRDGGSMYENLVSKVESLLGPPNRVKLADTILDRLSANIVSLDQMLGDHTKSLNEYATQIKTAPSIVSHSEDINASLKADLTKIADDIHESISAIKVAHKPTPLPRRNLNHSPNFCPPNQWSMSAPLAGRLSDTYSTWPGIPIPQPNIYRAQYGNPPHLSQYTGPPLYPPPHINRQQRHKITADPETSLVVYNIDVNCNIGQVVEQLCLHCNVYASEIVKAERFPRSPGGSSAPILISCSDRRLKFSFMKEINNLSKKESVGGNYQKVFARSYLTEEELKVDRMRVRKLKHIRATHIDRRFKIHRGEICEIQNDELIPFQDIVTPPSPNDSHSSLPAADDQATGNIPTNTEHNQDVQT